MTQAVGGAYYRNSNNIKRGCVAVCEYVKRNAEKAESENEAKKSGDVDDLIFEGEIIKLHSEK